MNIKLFEPAEKLKGDFVLKKVIALILMLMPIPVNSMQKQLHIKLIAEDTTSFEVSASSAKQALTIANMVTDLPLASLQNLEIPLPIHSTILGYVQKIMISLSHHMNLSGKDLLDALENDLNKAERERQSAMARLVAATRGALSYVWNIAHYQQCQKEHILALFGAVNFLDFTIGIQLIARIIARIMASDEGFKNMVIAQMSNMPLDAIREIGHFYFLLAGDYLTVKVPNPEFNKINHEIQELATRLKNLRDLQIAKDLSDLEHKYEQETGIMQTGPSYNPDYEQEISPIENRLHEIADYDSNTNQWYPKSEKSFFSIDIPGLDASKYTFSLREYLEYNSQLLNNRIQEMHQLHALNLSELNLTSIEGLNQIPGIQNVVEIDLHNNKLSTDAVASFEHLPHLVRLDLRNNSLQFRPGNFRNLPNLKTLALSATSPLIPHIFSGLNNLETLDIYYINTPIDPEIFYDLPRLETLNIFTQLPINRSQEKKLKKEIHNHAPGIHITLTAIHPML